LGPHGPFEPLLVPILPIGTEGGNAVRGIDFD
jgi:hypothetical protein